MAKIFATTTCFCLLSVASASVASAEVHVVRSSNVSAEISADRYRVKLRFTPDPEIAVWSVLKEGLAEEVGSFPLEGFARSRNGAPRGRPSAPQFMEARKEAKNDALVFTVLYGSPGHDQHRVVLEFKPAFFSYSLSVVKGHRREITELLYLSGSGNGGEVKYGHGRFQEVRTWTPDLYDVLIPDIGMSRLW